MLLGAVVEVPLDPAALAVAGLDDPRPRRLQLLLGPPAIGDVADVAREEPTPLHGDARDRELDRELGPVRSEAGDLDPPVEDRGQLGGEVALQPAAV
jgi:hypothetical protein